MMAFGQPSGPWWHGLLGGLLLLPAGAALAQDGAGQDERIAAIDMVTGQEISLSTVMGREMLVLMPRGEVIQKVVIDNDSAFHVALTASHDGFAIEGMKQSAGVHLEVTGQQGTYRFVLAAQASGVAPYVTRLLPTAGAVRPEVEDKPSVGSYRLTGDGNLLPSQIRDDGQKIYIQWAPDQPMPVVLSVDRRGKEEMTDGYMRGGSFTLDRLYDHLVFRLDKAEAHAIRTVRKAVKP